MHDSGAKQIFAYHTSQKQIEKGSFTNDLQANQIPVNFSKEID